MTYDENGRVLTMNQPVSLVHETPEWYNYLKNLDKQGYCRVVVEKVFEHDKDKNSYVLMDKIPSDIVKEVDTYVNVAKQVKLTPEQKEIAELKAQMAILLGKKEDKKVDIKDIEVVDEVVIDDLATLQAEYSKQNEGKEVPPRFKNDMEWIKSKLTK